MITLFNIKTNRHFSNKENLAAILSKKSLIEKYLAQQSMLLIKGCAREPLKNTADFPYPALNHKNWLYIGRKLPSHG
ncbi:hypothetical protein [Microbulbifer sp. GL-2]|uniref:hypothetical protein n=1 Tax=Microbulbifer sp. GL-2 TaxID=2591606 RepID=UPI001165BF55|nr:hypothetical protein [Microbulbifer sp. GL-2]BBM03636.1 hypothetical protein GL2_37100 [Microbulbifer sp. GL-2]